MLVLLRIKNGKEMMIHTCCSVPEKEGCVDSGDVFSKAFKREEQRRNVVVLVEQTLRVKSIFQHPFLLVDSVHEI